MIYLASRSEMRQPCPAALSSQPKQKIDRAELTHIFAPIQPASGANETMISLWEGATEGANAVFGGAAGSSY